MLTYEDCIALAELTEDTSKPVGFHNALFVLDPDTRLWVSLPVEALVKHVAELHDGNDHCSRSSDYRAIAQHAISLADDSKFFASAPVGIACPGGFYQLAEGGISWVAGALQDFNRVAIVGESSTFGKGTVQQPMPIAEMMPFFAARERAGYLKLTIQKFYRPSGSSTQMDGVVPQLVLPSLMDGLEIGESFLDNAMPHDRINPAPGFKPLDDKALFLPRLKEMSQQRVNDSKDFNYIIEDVMKNKERIKNNKVYLNKATRERELAEAETLRRERNSERRQRFSSMVAEDKKAFHFFKLTLDDLDKNADLHEYDPAAENADYMRRAKDETADLDDSPKWSSGLDPVKRESIMILRDLTNLTEIARLAGAPKKSPEEN